MTDHSQISKKEWISLARSFYSYLVDELYKMSDKEWKASTRYLGWDCKDLINHMTSAITINFNLLIQMALEGKPVPSPGFNLFLRNADEVARRRTDTIAKTIEEFKTEITRLMDRYDEMTEEHWRSPAFFYIGDVDIRTLFLVQFADNLVHERDLRVANRKEHSFNPKYIDPLLDWFMTAFRPASFRSGRSNNESALIQYHITGNVEGNWYMKVENNSCNVYQGTIAKPDVKVTMTVEDLISASLARSSPLFGKLARAIQWMVKKEKREDFAAKLTGIVAAISSVLSGNIKIEGDRKKGNRVTKKWFWHFWERTQQTQDNILRSGYRNVS